MGNTKSTGVNTEDSLVKERKCIICFDEGTSGLRCDFNHLLCHQCIAPYVNSVVEDVGKLKDQGFAIRCPAVDAGVQCKSAPWSSSALNKVMKDIDTMDRYVDALICVCKQGSTVENKPSAANCDVVPLLLDALNLRCPNAACRVVLDPSPDGCCAIRCGSCAVHACFLCFQICADSTSCHKHVRECPCSPKPDDLFIPEKDRLPALRRVRVMTIRQILAETLLGAGKRGSSIGTTDTGSAEVGLASNQVGEKLAKCARAKKILSTVQKELSDLAITVDDVFHLNVVVAARPKARPASVRGPILQPARPLNFGELNAAHDRASRMVFTVLLAMVLFFVILVYVINLLASISNRHKLENGDTLCAHDLSDGTGIGGPVEGCMNNATGGVYDYLVSSQRVVDIATGLECMDCEVLETQTHWGWLVGWATVPVLCFLLAIAYIVNMLIR